MNTVLKIALPALSMTLCFLGCSSESNTPTLATNKPYFLKEWPDKAYVQSIDSIIAAEPVKQVSKEKKTNIVLNAAPTTQIIPSEKPTKTEKTGAVKTKKTATLNKESFTEAFAKAISKWQSDPNNGSLYTSISVLEGEDAMALLARIYGKEAKKLPRFYTLSVLQSLNPGVSLENPTAGEKIRIPKI